MLAPPANLHSPSQTVMGDTSPQIQNNRRVLKMGRIAESCVRREKSLYPARDGRTMFWITSQDELGLDLTDLRQIFGEMANMIFW